MQLTFIFVPLVLLTGLYSCTDSNQAMDSLGEKPEVYFENEQLDSILKGYLQFIHTQPDEIVRKNNIILSFYKEADDTLLTIYGTEIIPVSVNAEYSIMSCYRDSNSWIYLSDNIVNPLGENFYSSAKKFKAFDGADRPKAEELPFGRDKDIDNRYWTYQVRDKGLVLAEKK